MSARVDTVRIIARNSRDRLGEGLWWSVREQAVYWVDILGQQIHRLILTDEQVTSWTMPEMIGWLIEREAYPGFIAGLGKGIVELELDPIRIRPIRTPEPDMPENRMNDAKADAVGRIWAGTMPISCDRPDGSFYRLDIDGALNLMDSGYTVTNGPAISADGGILYHTDSGATTVYRFALHDDGTLGPRAEHIRFERDWGVPDGMTVDADGGLWIAHWGGGRVSRFDPDGRLERSIALPASQITNCVFAGPKLDRMFVTSASDGREDEPAAGALFEIDPGVTGLAPYRYGG